MADTREDPAGDALHALAVKCGEIIQNDVGGTTYDSSECAYNVIREVGAELVRRLETTRGPVGSELGIGTAADWIRQWTES